MEPEAGKGHWFDQESFSLGEFTTAQIRIDSGGLRVLNCCESEPVKAEDLTALRAWLQEHGY